MFPLPRITSAIHCVSPECNLREREALVVAEIVRELPNVIVISELVALKVSFKKPLRVLKSAFPGILTDVVIYPPP